jgi:ATP-dependent DNA ligase
MARNAKGKYESGKRSKNLQKMKEFIDMEFPVIGVEEGRGKNAGTAITFVVRLENGAEARATYKATQKDRKKMFDNPHLWQGKILTVNFKRWTKDGNLYIPVAKGFRDPGT